MTELINALERLMELRKEADETTTAKLDEVIQAIIDAMKMRANTLTFEPSSSPRFPLPIHVPSDVPVVPFGHGPSDFPFNPGPSDVPNNPWTTPYCETKPPINLCASDSDVPYVVFEVEEPVASDPEAIMSSARAIARKFLGAK